MALARDDYRKSDVIMSNAIRGAIPKHGNVKRLKQCVAKRVGSAMGTAVDELRIHSVLFGCDGACEKGLIKRWAWTMADRDHFNLLRSWS